LHSGINLAVAICIVTAIVLPAVPTAPTRVHAQENTPGGSVGIVRGRGAILLDATGTTQIGSLGAGDAVVLLARSSDGALYYVGGVGTREGWVAANSLLVATATDLPVREIGTATSQGASSTPAAGESTSFALPTPTPRPNGGSATAGSGSTAPTPAGAVNPLLATVLSASSLTPSSTDHASDAAALPAPTIAVQVTLTNTRLNLRAAPGIEAAVVAKAESGSTWTVTGRSADGAWLRLADANGGAMGWGSAAYLDAVSGDIAAAPISGEVIDGEAIAVQPSSAPIAADPLPVAATTGTAPTSTATVGKTGLSGTLVFQDRIGGSIYVYDLGTDTLRYLTSGIDPAISNDGTRVAFTRDGGGAGLYIINLDGSGETRIYNERPYIRAPKWSPNDSMIAFSSVIGYNDCRILDGMVCLPDEAFLDALPPELQVPETMKALKDLPNQREFYYALARVDAGGGNFHDIPALDRAQAPDWNTAGITYHSSGAGIQITQDDPNARTAEVANDPLVSYFQDPDWQPNGGRIVYYRQMNGRHWQIFAVNPDGTGNAALTRPVTALVDELPSNVAPAWSPDGAHIVYLSNRNSIESAGAWHLWVMNADGSNQRMLPVDLPLDFTFSGEQVVSWGQ